MAIEPPLSPMKDRERLAQLCFEGFNSPCLYVGLSTVLALYANGRTTGCVLEIGEGSSHSNFKLCIGQTYKILVDQMTAMGVNNILMIDDVSSTQSLVDMFRKYKMQNIKVNSHILDKEYQKMLMAEDQSA